MKSKSQWPFSGVTLRVVGRRFTSVLLRHGEAVCGTTRTRSWVNNRYSNLRIYPQGVVGPIVSFNDNSNFITGVAAYKAFALLGGNINTFSYETSYLLTKQSIARGEVTTETCFAAAYDAVGNLYCGNEDQALMVVTQNGPRTQVTNLSFFRFDLAIDNARRYIYVSNTIGNRIAVYNTSGTLLYMLTN